MFDRSYFEIPKFYNFLYAIPRSVITAAKSEEFCKDSYQTHEIYDPLLPCAVSIIIVTSNCIIRNIIKMLVQLIELRTKSKEINIMCIAVLICQYLDTGMILTLSNASY
jgi:hypothetical protein